MNQKSIVFNYLSIIVDVIAWVGAYVLAYFMRARFDTLPVSYVWPFADYLTFVIYLTPLFLVTMMFEGLYNYRYPKKGLGQFTSIFISATAGVMYVVLWVFFTRSFFFSRLLIIYAWLISILFLLAGRWLLALIEKTYHKSGHGLRKVIIIGPEEQAIDIAVPLNNNPAYGFEVVGIIGDEKTSGNDIKYLGTDKNLDPLIKKYHVSDIIVSSPKLSQSEIIHLSEIARDNKVSFHLTPSALQIGARKFAAGTIAGLPVVEILETPLEGWASTVKRVFDIVGSLLFIIVFSWLYLIVALLVKLTSKGPVIYKDKRVGTDGEFYLYKFRTFKQEYCTGKEYGGSKAEKIEDEIIKEKNTRTGPIPKIKDDPRVTSIGNFLRKTSLDELPQFFNSLRGEISIVGPRPHRPKEVAGYQPRHKKLFLIKPGITGMAQVSGRSDLDFDDEADLDIYYIENWSIWLDFQIGIQTVFVVLGAKGAY